MEFYVGFFSNIYSICASFGSKGAFYIPNAAELPLRSNSLSMYINPNKIDMEKIKITKTMLYMATIISK